MENSTITLNDTTSEIVKVLPGHLLEPAIIISKILGYENVDAYAIDLIKNDLKGIYEGRHNDMSERVTEYLKQFIIEPEKLI